MLLLYSADLTQARALAVRTGETQPAGLSFRAMPQLIQRRQRFCHAALLSLVLSPHALMAATVGGVQKVDFSPTVVSQFCDVSTTGGSLAAEKKRGLITSDSAAGATGSSFTGTQGPGTIAVVSNLNSTGAVVVDPPQLTGPTAATTSELKLGSASYVSAAQSLKLTDDGSLASTPLHVRFTTTSTGGKFANGTYSAVATVTCTDDGIVK